MPTTPASSVSPVPSMPTVPKNAPIWINAGELSGDIHGAMLLEALRRKDPSLSFVGMGGGHLREAGLDCLFSIDSLSVMGFTEVLGHLPKIFRLLADIKKELAERRPRAVIVVDAPDFHFRVITAARALNIPVYYYISPKLWAWRQGRAEFIRQNVRRLISILPFEVEFYRRFNMEIDYVGNPLVDLVDYPALSRIEPVAGRIGILPGSRKKEIHSLMPVFAEAARILLQRLPHLSFVCPRAPNISEEELRALWPADIPLSFIQPENRWAAMRECEVLLAASGTVTLESAVAGVPTIICYKLSPLTYAVGKLLVKVPFMGLPNLIAGKEIFPELLQDACSAGSLAAKALAWLDPQGNDAPLLRVREELDALRTQLGEPGAVDRAATVILDDLREQAQTT